MVPWIDFTAQPWYIDVLALAALLGALGAIWRMALWPLIHAVWSAILAAPRIATGIDTLVQLVESDVLTRVRTLHDISVIHATRLEEQHVQLQTLATLFSDFQTVLALEHHIDAHDAFSAQAIALLNSDREQRGLAPLPVPPLRTGVQEMAH